MEVVRSFFLCYVFIYFDLLDMEMLDILRRIMVILSFS